MTDHLLARFTGKDATLAALFPVERMA